MRERHLGGRIGVLAVVSFLLGTVGLSSIPGTSASGTPVPMSGSGGRIAFSYEDDVWSMNVDGTGRVQLTTDAGPEFDPSWSPDGSRIVYRDSRRGINNDDEIYVMGADGSTKTNLTNNPANDWGPSWSPDGTRIAFSSDREGTFPRLFVMNMDGTGVTRLTEGWGEYPTWTPDGTKLAYQCLQGGGSSPTSRPNYDLCTVNADGTGEAILVAHPSYDGYPAWSSDGTTIAFKTERDACLEGKVITSEEACEDGATIYLVTSTGTDARRLTEPAPGGNQFPAWSPDGSKLVFVRAGQIAIIEIDSSDVIHLGPGDFPSWGTERPRTQVSRPQE